MQKYSTVSITITDAVQQQSSTEPAQKSTTEAVIQQRCTTEPVQSVQCTVQKSTTEADQQQCTTESVHQTHEYSS